MNDLKREGRREEGKEGRKGEGKGEGGRDYTQGVRGHCSFITQKVSLSQLLSALPLFRWRKKSRS